MSARIKIIAGVSLSLLVLLWLVEGTNLVLGGALDRNGIRPRDPNGLAGIIFAPFIHVSVAHLVANSGPLLVLSATVLLRGLRTFVLVSLVVMFVGGFALWLVGRPFSVQVGASGVIFGYLGYLLARGLVERSVGSVLVSVIVLIVYGGALWGLLPLQPGVSFEGHITGFVSGALAARLAVASRSDRSEAWQAQRHQSDQHGAGSGI